MKAAFIDIPDHVLETNGRNAVVKAVRRLERLVKGKTRCRIMKLWGSGKFGIVDGIRIHLEAE